MKPYQCQYCGKKFDVDSALSQHVDAKHLTAIKPKIEETASKEISSRKVKRYGIYVGIIVFIALAGYGIFQFSGGVVANIGPVGSTHEHVDFKMFLLGQPFDFRSYQLRSQYVHFEGGDGDVIHKHATGVTLDFFFKTLRMSFNKNCIVLDNGTRYCDDGTNTIKFYVNGNQSNLFEKYELHDLDKVLISYGNETPEQIQLQLANITDKAADQSGPVIGR